MSDDLLTQLMFPDHSKDLSDLKSGRRLVHYTNADAAYRIITSKEVWLRNAQLMNDFSEIEYGMSCLRVAWKSQAANRLRELFNRINPGMLESVFTDFEGNSEYTRHNTFIASLSTHNDGDEDRFGRLSMWRAYGGKAGVALVLNPDAFAGSTMQIRAFSFRVRYSNVDEFLTQFVNWSDALIAHENEIGHADPARLSAYLGAVFRSFVLCTKHKAFSEELEWRVVHSPRFDGNSDWLEPATEIIHGIPQQIIKLKLFDDLERGVAGVAPSNLLNRVIIGPCDYPVQVKQALVAALKGAGVAFPNEKVWASLIPLRH